jgi:hypothetical protein
MAKNETCEEREARRIRIILERCESVPEIVEDTKRMINNHRSEAQKRIEEAKRKCSERREKRDKARLIASGYSQPIIYGR